MGVDYMSKMYYNEWLKTLIGCRFQKWNLDYEFKNKSIHWKHTTLSSDCPQIIFLQPYTNFIKVMYSRLGHWTLVIPTSAKLLLVLTLHKYIITCKLCEFKVKFGTLFVVLSYWVVWVFVVKSSGCNI